MYTLGIVGGPRIGYQDPAATLVRGGEVVAAVEEERLVRQKHAAGLMPERAMRYALEAEGITIQDVDLLVLHGSTWLPDFRPFARDFVVSRFGHCPPIELIHHHDAHCASAFYASGFPEAMVLSLDLSGDGVATQLAVGSPRGLEVVERIQRPNSLGIFFAMITEYCGFSKYDAEYKLMGLSSYGDRGRYDLSWLLRYGDGTHRLSEEYIQGFRPGEHPPTKHLPIYNERFLQKMGVPARLPDAPMSKHYEDVAASAQQLLEDAIVHLVTEFHRRTGLRSLCLAGGVALNVVVNQRLSNLEFIDQIYVQPASHDAGVSLGAAYLGAVGKGQRAVPMESAYLGPSYDNAEIAAALRLANVAYKEVDDVAEFAAERVAQGKIVGWFQGRMEFGPRALGSRSILADPRLAEMKDIVNERVKFREQFRPFCPSVLEEEASRYFAGKGETSPYMTITYDVRDEYASELPAITHVDQTARIQTVNRSQNPLYYDYLTELKKRIGCGVTLNTSLNVRGMPIDTSPYHALCTMFGSGMDALVMGNLVLEK
jgi:carbamoyltransferase